MNKELSIAWNKIESNANMPESWVKGQKADAKHFILMINII
jgi:hypothetical protein